MSSALVTRLPLLAVSEVARATESDIVLLDDFENFRLRNRFISLVRPARIFGLERRRGGRGRALRGNSAEMFIIVVSIGGKRVGLAADTLVGEQEIVIKPLESQWLYNDALAGASVLGDGRVALYAAVGAQHVYMTPFTAQVASDQKAFTAKFRQAFHQ